MEHSVEKVLTMTLKLKEKEIKTLASVLTAFVDGVDKFEYDYQISDPGRVTLLRTFANNMRDVLVDAVD